MSSIPTPPAIHLPPPTFRPTLANHKPLRNVLSMPYEALTKERLTRALRRLSELATAEGIVLEIDLYGGAVFTLVYGSRETTKDIDAIVRPQSIGEN